MQRSEFLASALAAAVLAGRPLSYAEIERRTGGRLGVAVLDPVSDRFTGQRLNERFPMCSTFKVLAAAATLQRVQSGKDSLARRISYGRADLQDYAPVARMHLAQGFMTLRDLCGAAIEYSDNTAANLLLRELGGPQAVTRFARSIGDAYTRLDDTEPALNYVPSGSNKNTTTPAAMARNLRRLLSHGDVLAKQSRSMLADWMHAARTGTDLLRAGMPKTWYVGDKTGLGGAHNATGASETRNDIAYVRTHSGEFFIAAYLTHAKGTAAQRDAALAAVGKIAASAFS